MCTRLGSRQSDDLRKRAHAGCTHAALLRRGEPARQIAVGYVPVRSTDPGYGRGSRAAQAGPTNLAHAGTHVLVTALALGAGTLALSLPLTIPAGTPRSTKGAMASINSATGPGAGPVAARAETRRR
ncbi:hypothetical protein EES42_42885 [Streptomyces sp. ADI95-17]|nr:hypothetical protein EES42_42885 [Streptomyces sp. ADI95-17]